MDDNAYWLAENARKFMIENAVTKSYFDGKDYVMTGGVITEGERDIKEATEVRIIRFRVQIFAKTCFISSHRFALRDIIYNQNLVGAFNSYQLSI